ncbi:MAG: hypothetical protein AAGI54_00645 [Planctomycetota bacterium]
MRSISRTTPLLRPRQADGKRRAPRAFWCSARRLRLQQAFALDHTPRAPVPAAQRGDQALALTPQGPALARWGVTPRPDARPKAALDARRLDDPSTWAHAPLQRVAIPATSWLARGQVYAAMHRHRLFALAALAARCPLSDALAFILLTVPATGELRRHARVAPVVLSPLLAQRWVHGNTDEAHALARRQLALPPRLVVVQAPGSPPDSTSARRRRSRAAS